MKTLIVVNYQMDVDRFIEEETNKENGLECIKYELNMSGLDRTSDIFRVVSMIGSFDIIFIEYLAKELTNLLETNNIPFVIIYPRVYEMIIEEIEELRLELNKQLKYFNSDKKYTEISENEIIDRNQIIEWKNKIGIEEFNTPTYNVYIDSIVNNILIAESVTKEKAEELCKLINKINKESNKVRAYYIKVR